MEPTDGLQRGMTATDLGRPITVPVGPATLLDGPLRGSDPPLPADLTNALGLVQDHLDDLLIEAPSIADLMAKVRAAGLASEFFMWVFAYNFHAPGDERLLLAVLAKNVERPRDVVEGLEAEDLLAEVERLAGSGVPDRHVSARMTPRRTRPSPRSAPSRRAPGRSAG